MRSITAVVLTHYKASLCSVFLCLAKACVVPSMHCGHKLMYEKLILLMLLFTDVPFLQAVCVCKIIAMLYPRRWAWV